MITRRRVLAAGGGLAALAAAPQAPATDVPTTRGKATMEIKRTGSQPSGKGPAEYFTGPCASTRSSGARAGARRRR